MKLKNWSEDLEKNGVPHIKITPPGPKSSRMISEAKKYITSCWAGKKCEAGDGWDLPLTVKKVANSLVEDVDGNVYLDLNSGISTQNFGYNNPEIFHRALELMKEYGMVGIFPSNDYNTPLMIDASRKLLETVPHGDYRVHYACDGTEANEAAIKAAVSYTGRGCVVSFMGGFYGRTMGSLSCMSQKARDSETFRPLRSANIYFAEGPNCPNCMFCDVPEDCNAYCIEHFLKDRVLSYQAYPHEVAAFLLEPYTTGGLMHPAQPEFIKAVREITEENGIVLIFDEVQAGMGRSGKMWVHEHYGVEPDIFTSAKSLGGGVAPLSAAFIQDEIMENLPAYHGSTYGGAPISLAGNMAALEYLENYDLLDRVNRLGKRIGKRLSNWTDYDKVWQTRGWGLLKAVDFRKAKDQPLAEYKSHVQNELFQKGVITMGGGQGRYLSLLRIMPPFTIPEEQLDAALDIFEEVIG